MKITEIEGLSFAELKNRREELLGFLEKDAAEVLARRYLKARTDAKQRDEKLAVQGRVIKGLEGDLIDAQNKAISQDRTNEALQDQAVNLVAQIEVLKAALSSARQKNAALLSEEAPA